jgi:hypothetical protein
MEKRMFDEGDMVKAVIDGHTYRGRVTISDSDYTQFIDEDDELKLRTIIARNREDRVELIPGKCS